jgi:hypothetical protein
MELEFGPKFSRIAAGLCFASVFGLVEYVLHLHWVFRAVLLLLFLSAMLSIVLPKNVMIENFFRRIARAMNPETLLEWLEDRFEKLKTHIKI